MRIPAAAVPSFRPHLRPLIASRTFVRIVAGACLLLLAPAAWGQKPYPAIHAGSLNGALAEAEERNALVLCVLLQGNEETNDAFYEGILRHADFVAAAADTLLLVANDDKHRATEVEEVDDEGNITRRTVCARFRTPTCETHTSASLPIFNRFKRGEGDSAALTTPFLAILRSNGKTHSRFEDVVDRPRILGGLKTAKKVNGPSISREQLSELQRHLSSGQSALESGLLGDAWRSFEAARTLLSSGPLGQSAVEGQALAVELVEESAATSLAKMEAGEIETGWRALTALAANCVDTPLEKDLAAKCKETRKDKRWREEIRQIEKEDEAQALLDEILAFLKAGNERKALSRGKRLRDRFGDTKAYARFRREHAELVDKIKGD